jgi:hypothetical protein
VFEPTFEILSLEPAEFQGNFLPYPRALFAVMQRR